MISLNRFRPDPKPEKREKKKPKPLPKKTKRQARDDEKYNKRAAVWIEDKECPCCNGPAEQVHHMKGRKGYADEWALLRGIKLIHDERFWLGVCYTLHDKIEKNPEWARAVGYSSGL